MRRYCSSWLRLLPPVPTIVLAVVVVVVWLVGAGVRSGPDLVVPVALLVWLAFMVTASLGGMWVRGDQVVIVNPLRVRRLRRQDIQAFEVDTFGIFGIYEVGRARLRDGTTIRLVGISEVGSGAPVPRVRGEVHRVVDQLNRDLTEAS